MAVKIFEFYGRFCARYALEVIVCFMTMVVGAVTLNVSSPYELCHWASNCAGSVDESQVSSDIVLITVLRCGTIIYVYMQLKKIWKIGSACVIGIVCAYTVFAVMTFSVTLVHFLRKDMVVVSNALPVFLLLIDITRMVVLTKHCLSTNSLDSLQDYIAEGMGALNPILTLDTLIELLLLINIGGFVQVRQLQQLSCFACLSVIINYIVFTTFVPACMSVLLTLLNKTKTYDDDFYTYAPPSWYDERFTQILQKEKVKDDHKFKKQVKFLLCLCLVVLHWFRGSLMFYNGTSEKIQNSFDSIFTLTPEQFFTVILIIILGSKYLLDDGYEIVSRFRRTSEFSVATPPVPTYHETCEKQVIAKNTYLNLGNETTILRTTEECKALLKVGADLLTDAEIIALVQKKELALYKLETELQNANRGVAIRRKILNKRMTDDARIKAFSNIPYTGYDFTTATKACCENTVGYIPIPLGLVGPLRLDNQDYMIPMATTEGTLLASTNRGLKALYIAGGVNASVYGDGMTRAPVVEFQTAEQSCRVATWLQDSYNFTLVKDKFDETSRFAKLKRLMPAVSGRLLFIRFVASTGDAMGMNMLSKGVENALRWLCTRFPEMKVVSLSGNFCTDKKPSAMNWINGRGKSVVCEARIPAQVIKEVLKTNVQKLTHLNRCKNHIGSAMAGSIGGFNAHAANIVTAIFIATGQDPAQNVVSSNCITTLEEVPACENGDTAFLHMTCTMPSLEVATVGGGTALEPQKSCLGLLNVAGSSQSKPGTNACNLAKLICGTVLAGELSLLSALASGDLVDSHIRYNRLKPNIE
uniref:3-hydroxy-3-methylglutaryl coenzyme A reductase n=1 Tax=Ciona savignyi TaxID=51511 RepID=H2ZDD6_CIOSA